MSNESYNKPQQVLQPEKKHNVSVGSSIKMVYGNKPSSLPECVKKPDMLKG